MTTTISTAARNAAVNNITLLLNAGGAGMIEIRSGTKPAGPDAAPTDGMVLAEVPFAADAFGDAISGQATALGTPLEDDMAVGSGTATWFRAKSGAGTAVFDGDISTSSAGTGDLQLNSTTIDAGGPVRITSFTFSIPASE